LFLGQPQGFAAAHDAELFAVTIDDTKLWCPNCPIQASAVADTGSPYVFLDPRIVSDKRTEVKRDRYDLYAWRQDSLAQVAGREAKAFDTMLCQP
jgi:hypothetical protein